MKALKDNSIIRGTLKSINILIIQPDHINFLGQGKNNCALFQRAKIFVGEWLEGISEFSVQTSGSTGEPKLIRITRKQMEASAMMTIEALSLQAGYHAVTCINTDYIGGKMMLVRSLVGGLKCYVIAPSSNPFEHIPSDLPVDFMSVVPLQIESMIDKGLSTRLNNVKSILVGGAPISSRLFKKIKKLTTRVYATYGMTETVSHVALNLLTDSNSINHYQVLEGVRIGQDERNCLIVKGLVTNGDQVITNDVVRIIDKNSFEWLGRFDNIINSGGIKINPEQIEPYIDKLLYKMKINNNNFIGGVHHSLLGELVCLFIEAKPFSKNTEEEIINKLKEKLPKYHCPKRIIYLPAFFYTKNGKINREKTIGHL